MDVLVECKDEFLELDGFKVEPLFPNFEDDMIFNSEFNHVDSDFMKQWNIESCLGTGIDLERNDLSPPLSPSSNESTPSGDSQSSFDLNQLKKKVSSKLFVPNVNYRKKMCNTNIAIAPKPTNTSQKVQKLNISTSLKPIIVKTSVSSETNNAFNVSSMLTNQNTRSPVDVSNSFGNGAAVTEKIILSQNEFLKLTKTLKQEQTNLVAPASVNCTPKVNSRLPLSAVETDLKKSRHNSITLQYNQLSAIKRHHRMIRNREAASLSRQKKKEYVTSLEEKINNLQKENLELKIENSALKERLKIFDRLSSLTDRPIIKKAKKATAILSVVLLISLNVVPLGLFNSSQIDNSVAQMHHNNRYKTKNIGNLNFHSRNLLWVNDFEDTNSSSNTTEHLMCPTFINISESKRIDSELRKWIEPKNLKSLNDNLSMAYLKPQILSTNIEQNKHGDFADSKDKKQNKLHKKILKKKNPIPFKNDFIEIFDQLKLDSKESLFDSIERQNDTFYVVSFSGDHLLLPASDNASTSLRPKMSLVFPTLSSNGSDFVTMIQIDCAVTDTKTLHIRDTHLRHHNDFKNNASATLKHQHDYRNNIAHKPYFVRQSYSGSMFRKMNQGLPIY